MSKDKALGKITGLTVNHENGTIELSLGQKDHSKHFFFILAEEGDEKEKGQITAFYAGDYGKLAEAIDLTVIRDDALFEEIVQAQVLRAAKAKAARPLSLVSHPRN